MRVFFMLFLTRVLLRGSFFYTKEVRMQTMPRNEFQDEKTTLVQLSRIIYAETRASSLPAVEALASMIGNICKQSMCSLAFIAVDESTFECFLKNSARHSDMLIAEDDPKFQMCLRVAKRMTIGQLPDSVRGAVRFHREDSMPDWATDKGSIAEIDGLLFYK